MCVQMKWNKEIILGKESITKKMKNSLFFSDSTSIVIHLKTVLWSGQTQEASQLFQEHPSSIALKCCGSYLAAMLTYLALLFQQRSITDGMAQQIKCPGPK